MLEMIKVYPHNHRYTARPGENGDVAAGTPPAQYQAAVTPIGGQKGRRRHIIASAGATRLSSSSSAIWKARIASASGSSAPRVSRLRSSWDAASASAKA